MRLVSRLPSAIHESVFSIGVLDLHGYLGDGRDICQRISIGRAGIDCLLSRRIRARAERGLLQCHYKASQPACSHLRDGIVYISMLYYRSNSLIVIQPFNFPFVHPNFTGSIQAKRRYVVTDNTQLSFTFRQVTSRNYETANTLILSSLRQVTML